MADAGAVEQAMMEVAIAASEDILSEITITSVDELSHSVLDSFVNLKL